MPLNSKQKNFIKKNVKKMPLAELSANLNISEKEVLGYLKKKWSKEKYHKFISPKQSSLENSSRFEFKKFASKHRIQLIFLSILVFFVYANSLKNAFVSDDIMGILKNENIGKTSNLFQGLFNSYFTNFIYLVVYKIWGLNPVFFRLTNIIFHLGTTLAIYVLLNILYSKRIALIASTFFAVHPILVESVTWISGGPYTRYSFFFIASFIAYLLSDNNRRFLYLSILLFTLSLASSANAAVLFLIFPFYEYVRGNLKYTYKKIVPFAMLGIFSALTLVLNLGHRASDLQTSSYQQQPSMINPLFQVPIAISSYLKLIFWPAKLSLYQTEMSFGLLNYLALLFIFLLLLGSIVFFWKKNKTIFFWLSFFVIALLPTLTPFGISWIVAERYAYLASLGIFVIVAFGLDWLWEKSKDRGENFEKMFYVLVSIMVLSLSIRTIIRNRDWKNEDTLWIATAKVSPSGQQIHNNLGDVYGRAGNQEKAIEEFKKAIEINPNYADAYHNLANTYQEIGQTDLAIENYQKAAEINPMLWQSYQNLANIYYGQKKYDLALENIEKAIKIEPENQNLLQAKEKIEEEIGK